MGAHRALRVRRRVRRADRRVRAAQHRSHGVSASRSACCSRSTASMASPRRSRRSSNSEGAASTPSSAGSAARSAASAASAGSVPAIWTQMRGWKRDLRRATMQVYNIAMQVLTLAIYGQHARAQRDVVEAVRRHRAADAADRSLYGTRIYNRVSERGFARLVLALIACPACRSPSAPRGRCGALRAPRTAPSRDSVRRRRG